MAEAVDSIIAELVVRGIDQYEAAFARMKKAHEGALPSLQAIGDQSVSIEQAAQRYKRGASDIAGAEEQTTQRVVRAKKAQGDAAKKLSDDEKAAAKSSADAVKAAAREKVAAEKAAAREIAAARRAEERANAQRTAAAERAYYRAGPRIFESKAREYAARDAAASAPAPSRGVTVAADLFGGGGGVRPGTGALLGTTDAGARSTAARQTDLMRSTKVEAEGVAKAEAEINHQAADLYDLERRRAVLSGQRLRDVEREIDLIRRINTYKQQGFSEEQAQLRAEKQIAEIETYRAEKAALQSRAMQPGGRRGGLGGLNEFALQASGGRLGYSFGPGALAGAAVLGGGAIVGAAATYGRGLSDTSKELGVSTRDLQVYQAMAAKVGVTNDQVGSSFGELANKISRARDGDQSAQKIFKGALNIDVSKFRDVGDALPTIIDRLSKIQDPAQRAAIGTELFGSAYRKLDSILAGGNAKIEEFGRAMGDAILTDTQIQALKDASDAIEDVKHQLLIDFSRTVANNKDAIIGLADAIGKLTGKLLDFANSHPETSLALIGAYAGGRIGGLPGAVAGGIAGYVGGQKLQQSQADSNTDPAFRLKQAQDARDKLLRLRASPINAADKSDAIDAASREVIRQNKLLQDARASAPSQRATAGVQPGDPSARGIANAFAPKPPKGKSQESLEKEAAARQKRFEDQQAAANADFLASLEQLSTSTDERYRLAADGLRVDHDRRATDIALQVKAHQIDAAREKELKAANDIAYAGRLAVLGAQKRAEQLQLIAQLQEQQVDRERQHLANQEPFLRTPQDRLKNQLAQIDAAERAAQEKAARVFTDPNATDDDKRIASGELNNARDDAEEQRRIARKQNQSPFQEYADKLPRTAKEVANEFEQAAVNGVEALNSSLDHSIEKMLHLHGVAGQIVGDFIQIALHAAEAQLFKGLLGGAGGLLGGGGGGGLGGVFKGVSHLFGFADGGSGVIQGNPGVDRNVLSINGRPVARVSAGERLAIVPPNIGTAAGRVAARNTTVVQQTIHVDGRNSVTPEGFAGQILDEADRRAQTYSKAAYTGALNGAPSRVRYVQQSEG